MYCDNENFFKCRCFRRTLPQVLGGLLLWALIILWLVAL